MTPEQHFHHLAEFISGVELSGGTTPHVAMTVDYMSRLDDPLEKLWMAGCYALTYNWATAERVFLEWRPADFDQEKFLAWSEENWDGIALRKERKAVFRKTAFTESAATYLDFAKDLVSRETWPTTYESAFSEFAAGCKYMGRYIGIRWLEVMRRAFGTDWEMGDIRADGGEHPRKTLALIYPEDRDMLLKGNTAAHVKLVDEVADRLLLDLKFEHDLDTNYYELQSLLCEYKQSALGRKQYPGKSIDTEMDYFYKIYSHWGAEAAIESDFFTVRARCFPEWSLGEKQGWDGVRKELGSVLVNYGYTWTDAEFDYVATENLATPVLRGENLL